MHGKPNFIFQGLKFAKDLLEEMRKIVYVFVWDGRKGIGWRQMEKCKKHEGIGLRDVRTLAKVATIKRAIKIWEGKQSRWSL